MTDPRKRAVTIDDLLKLKRAEAPAADFWPQFERELREKQLAAIVERRPWWVALPSVYAFVVRRRLSLAAGASALTIGLLSFNVYHDSRAGLEASASDLQVAAPSAPEMAAPTVAAARVSPGAILPAPARALAVAGADRISRPAARMAVASNETVPAIPLLDDMPPSGATERFDALSRSLGGELATSPVSIPAGARSLLVGTRDFGSRLIPTRTSSADPLAQMQAPAEHRSRLLAEAYTAMASAGDVVAPPSERVLSSLSDDRLYSSGNRYDLATEHNAIKLSIQF
jgi:hypothetical protein